MIHTRNMYVADDGSVHKTRAEAEHADARHAIEMLVERHVPYSDGKQTVLDFLREHGSRLGELLHKLHCAGN